MTLAGWSKPLLDYIREALQLGLIRVEYDPKLKAELLHGTVITPGGTVIDYVDQLPPVGGRNIPTSCNVEWSRKRVARS